ncbi:MAG: hypothetical protein CMJ78_16440 [Planctomycetaceae bacterium]|nr:hypothetical protein [Planctomycetaceae bacterium]
MRLVGVGYRHALADWIETRPAEVECLEITAEHFFGGGDNKLRGLSETYPLYVHGLGLSLGTPGPLDSETLESFIRVADLSSAAWVSEHVAFTRTSEVDLGHLNPISPNRETLAIFAEHVQQLQQQSGRKVIVENITTHLRVVGEFAETEFLNQLCEQTGCGLLFDTTNLFINSKNHGFDASQWLHELEPSNIVQLHVVGYSLRGPISANMRWHDHHSEPIQDDLLELTAEVCEYAPVQAIILERDLNLDDIESIVNDLRRLKDVCGAAIEA